MSMSGYSLESQSEIRFATSMGGSDDTKMTFDINVRNLTETCRLL